MKQILAVVLVAALAVPAVGRTCQGGKCVSPAKRESMARAAMKQRLSKPLVQSPAIKMMNQQIVTLARTNVGGRNNQRIKALQTQRNQMLSKMR